MSDYEGESPIQAYARVLHNYVNDRGEVNFPALRRDRADIERYLVYIARTPASAISNPRERLAHYINSYNALSMYNVIDLGIPETHGMAKDSLLRTARVQHRRQTDVTLCLRERCHPQARRAAGPLCA